MPEPGLQRAGVAHIPRVRGRHGLPRLTPARAVPALASVGLSGGVNTVAVLSGSNNALWLLPVIGFAVVALGVVAWAYELTNPPEASR